MTIAFGKRPSGHQCGACKARLFTARFTHSGLLVHVEVDPRSEGDLLLIPELPGTETPGQPVHVTRTSVRRTPYREHVCPNVAWSAAGFAKKARP